MTRHKLFGFIICFLIAAFSLSAEVVNIKKYNFSLDLPEGYKFESKSQDGKQYSFNHPDMNTTLLIKVYEGRNYKNAKACLKDSISNLNSDAEIGDFNWNDQECAITNFQFALDQNYAIYGICTPLSCKKSTFAVILNYTHLANEEKAWPFIFSTINSLSVKEDDYLKPGILISFLYPQEEILNYKFKLFGKEITTSFDSTDGEASQTVVDLEYYVLNLYRQHNLVMKAWERYYRMIYRDSWGRIEDCMDKVLNTFEPYAAYVNPDQPELTLAQWILTWVQSMEYGNRATTQNDSDFTSLPRALMGEPNDCDSRALLVCMFMRAMGLDSFMLISPEYSHALATVDIDAPGQKYNLQGSDKEYLMGETTEAVTWGMIAQDQADRSKWYPIILP